MDDNKPTMNRQDMEAAMRLLIDNQEFLEASMKPMAEMLYQKFRALVEAGFTEEQAMDLVKARGISA